MRTGIQDRCHLVHVRENERTGFAISLAPPMLGLLPPTRRQWRFGRWLKHWAIVKAQLLLILEPKQPQMMMMMMMMVPNEADDDDDDR